jgi:hypothetical protein
VPTTSHLVKTQINIESNKIVWIVAWSKKAVSACLEYIVEKKVLDCPEQVGAPTVPSAVILDAH